MKKIILFLIISTQTLFAQQVFKPNPFSKTLTVGFEPGATYSITDYKKSEFDFSGKFFIEVFLKSDSKSSFGLRALLNTGFIKGFDKTIPEPESQFRARFLSLGLGLIYLLSASEITFPYLSVGSSLLWFEPIGLDGKPMRNYLSESYSPRELNFFGEVGSRFLLTNNLSFNINAGIQISPNDNLDDTKRGTSNDMFFTGNIGLTYSLFVEIDSDKDGVPDSRDKCPSTPLYVSVDDFGCPLDNDSDGIPDYLDKCVNTPRGVQVDEDGCPIDSDKDGVPDYRDLCPDTPKRISVDDFGCPFDSDNDGIPDYLDKCPNTPAGVDVDSKGCPLDSDLDGIPDHLDECPDSAPGEIVDEKGCKKIIEIKTPQKDTVEVEKPSIKEMTLKVSEIFEKDGITLKQISAIHLDKILDEMKREPLSRWIIESHTDNVGSAEANLKTSQRRADAIQNYFLSRGISKIRIEAIGYGIKFPIADNKTQAGRDLNRRIIIKRKN
jgi:outer membrane protein OmpA-like peptidoglycan-associated protein